MFEFNFLDNFIPSRNVLNYWNWTPKSATSSHGIQRPGLFNNPNYSWHGLGVVLILVFETWATLIALDLGVQIMAIIIAIVMDFVLAFVSHIWVKDINKAKNALVFADNILRQQKVSEISRTKVVKNFFNLCILTLGFFKFYWFYSVYNNPDVTALFVFSCYTLGAVLHISCTGYFFYTLIIGMIIKGQHSEYINSGGKKYSFDPENPLPHEIISSISLVECSVGKHKIVKNKDNKFYFETCGLLTDKELNEFIGRQINNEQQRVVAVEGVRHQYNFL